MSLVVSVLVLSAPAALGTTGAVAPKDGLYKGKSAQGHPVQFRVRASKIGGPVKFTVSGSGGCRVTVHYVVVPGKINPNGTFKLASAGTTVKGRFVTDTSVKGTISAPSCTSAPRSVAFSARRS